MIHVALGLLKVSKPSCKNRKRYEIKFAIVKFACRNNRSNLSLGSSFLTLVDSQFPLSQGCFKKSVNNI